MKIYNSIGSKERLFEMMSRVNKALIKEVNIQDNNDVLESKFNELKNKQLNISHSNIQTLSNNESFAVLECYDNQGNRIIFRFKAAAQEGDQQGIYNITNVALIEFDFETKNAESKINMQENDLKEFNIAHTNELFEIVSEYIDFESGEETPELDEAFIDAAKKIDSYPFGGTPRTLKASQAYGDEQPTNPKVRVKAPELEKFVDESDDYPKEIGKKFKTKKQYSDEKKKKETSITIDEEHTIADIESGEKLNIGDIVTANGLVGEYQIGVKYSEGKPFLMPFDASTKKANTAYKIYLTSIVNPQLKKVLNYSETEGGFMKEGDGMSFDSDADRQEEIIRGKEEEEFENKEMEDILLGFEPKNVGDKIDEKKPELCPKG